MNVRNIDYTLAIFIARSKPSVDLILRQLPSVENIDEDWTNIKSAFISDTEEVIATSREAWLTGQTWKWIDEGNEDEPEREKPFLG